MARAVESAGMLPDQAVRFLKRLLVWLVALLVVAVAVVLYDGGFSAV